MQPYLESSESIDWSAPAVRVNGIPAALCDQRLSGDEGPTIHGLNAIALSAYGWYRVDPRGNNKHMNAQFSPPVEKLAFALQPGDEEVPGYWSRPAPEVIDFLNAYSSVASDDASSLPVRLWCAVHQTANTLSNRKPTSSQICDVLMTLPTSASTKPRNISVATASSDRL